MNPQRKEHKRWLQTTWQGVETIEVERGPRPVRTVKSAVIGLIGTGADRRGQSATLTLSEKDAAAFGSQLPGFTIPQGAGRDLRPWRWHGDRDQRARPGDPQDGRRQ
jgi:hypothetical protein